MTGDNDGMTTSADSPPRGAANKWWVVGAYWAVQAAFVLIAGAVIWGAGSASDVIDALSDASYVLWALAAAAGLMLAQAVFVWPVRRPVSRAERGWPVLVSLGLAGLGAALVFVGLAFGLMEVIELVGGEGSDLDQAAWQAAWWGGLGLGWLVATPLLIAFARGRRAGRRETMLGRIAARLFLGTIIETAAIIPLDVMVRRRTDCYCGEGTFYALLICGGVGTFALGPAIWLPLLARRRKRWYEGRCDACGYDMRGTPAAERCPECGAGWRAVQSEE